MLRIQSIQQVQGGGADLVQQADGGTAAFFDYALIFQLDIGDLARVELDQSQLAAAQSEYDYLSTKMSDITSRASLQEVAEGQLGLVKLDPSQITYVQLEDESVIQKSTNTAGKLLGEVRTAALSLLNNLNP